MPAPEPAWLGWVSVGIVMAVIVLVLAISREHIAMWAAMQASIYGPNWFMRPRYVWYALLALLFLPISILAVNALLRALIRLVTGPGAP
jgi:hypothetical protein